MVIIGLLYGYYRFTLVPRGSEWGSFFLVSLLGASLKPKSPKDPNPEYQTQNISET